MGQPKCGFFYIEIAENELATIFFSVLDINPFETLQTPSEGILS